MAARKPFRPFATIVALVIVAAYYLVTGQIPGNQNDPAPNPVSQAYLNRQSDVLVELEGTVTRILPDDNEGSRHQKFIVAMADKHTILVSHNIDLAPRINDIAVGQRIKVKGEYEYNNRGGVVHWTHHDPAGQHPGGWIDYGGKRYQ